MNKKWKEKHIWRDIDGKRVACIDYTLGMCSVLSLSFTGSMFLTIQVWHKTVKFSLKLSHKQTVSNGIEGSYIRFSVLFINKDLPVSYAIVLLHFTVFECSMRFSLRMPFLLALYIINCGLICLLQGKWYIWKLFVLHYYVHGDRWET